MIVNADKKIVGIGYNGMSNGCSDDTMPWGRKLDDLVNDKHLYGINLYICLHSN